MKLSKRIYKIAEMVQRGETAADIGTDHGYVPMLLIKNSISSRVIMSDISEASLSKARETFRLCELHADESDFRTGDGLDTIRASEVDDIIIAGLGGYTIADVLDSDILKSRSFKKLILQPRKHSGALRHYLYTHGWDITYDVLAPEGKFQCEIIVAVPGRETFREEPYPADDIRWKYPKKMLETSYNLAVKRIKWKIKSIEEQLHNMKEAGSKNPSMMESMKSDLGYLKDLIYRNEICDKDT